MMQTCDQCLLTSVCVPLLAALNSIRVTTAAAHTTQGPFAVYHPIVLYTYSFVVSCNVYVCVLAPVRKNALPITMRLIGIGDECMHIAIMFHLAHHKNM